MHRVLSLIVLLLLTAGMAGAQQPVRVELFLTFIPNVQFAPVYVALEQGYFAEAGLDVQIRHGAEHDGVDLVAADQLQFGIFGGEQVLLARAQGRPVVSVYEWFQRFPAGVLAAFKAGETPPEDFSDLAGQRVGIHGRSGVTWTAFVALLRDAGLTEQDLVLESVGFNVPELVCLGLIDAAVVYLNNEPLQIGDRISAGDCGDVQGFRVFPVTSVADLVSNVIVTNEMTLESDSGLVQSLVLAFDRGLQEAIANPAAAMLASVPYVEGLVAEEELPLIQALAEAFEEYRSGEAVNSDAFYEAFVEHLLPIESAEPVDLLQLRVLLTTIPLWEAEVLGYSARDSWVTTAESLLAAGMLEEAPDVDRAFTNRFVPGCDAVDACT